MSDDYRIGEHRGKLVLRTKDERRGWLRTSLGTNDRGLAEARARRIWTARTAPVSERIRDLWPAYVRDRLEEVSRKDRFKATWTALEPHFGHRLGTAITKADCKEYHRSRRAAGKSDSTARTELELLRACLNLT
ncbi:MAG TPA: hypothetical protein VGR19_05975, partial [Allosphingosinicella sp.]|nr:hypothetical protein [Allosphingosinicella sp.]